MNSTVRPPDTARDPLPDAASGGGPAAAPTGRGFGLLDDLPLPFVGATLSVAEAASPWKGLPLCEHPFFELRQ